MHRVLQSRREGFAEGRGNIFGAPQAATMLEWQAVPAHFEDETRQSLNRQTLSIAASRSASQSAELAVELGGGCPINSIFGFAKLAWRTKSEYLKKLHSFDILSVTEAQPVKDHGIIKQVLVGTVPFKGTRALASRLISSARHQIVFLVLDAGLAKHVYRPNFVPFMHQTKHEYTTLALDFTDDDRVHVAAVKTKKVTSSLGRSKEARDTHTEMDRDTVKRYLQDHGVQVVDAFSPWRETPAQEVLQWAEIFSRQNAEYDIESINCRSFAETIVTSIRCGDYTFCSDEGRDSRKKRAALALGLASTRSERSGLY